MGRKLKIFLVILSILTVGSFSAAALAYYVTGGIKPIAASGNQISDSREFEFDNIEQINISTVSTNNINIISYDETVIKVDFYGKIITAAGSAHPSLEADIENEELNIKIKYPDTQIIRIFDISELQLDVSLPHEYSKNLSVSAISSQININNLNLQKLNTKTVSGALTATILTAEEIFIESTSGKVILEKVSGKLNINTVSGNVFADLKNLEEDINIKSISGAVELLLSEDSMFSFILESISGKIDNKFESEIIKADSNGLEGSVGNGLHKIFIKTVSGRIMLEKN